MNGKAHKVFALGGAVILNNVVNLCPSTSVKVVNLALHAAGPLYDPLHLTPDRIGDHHPQGNLLCGGYTDRKHP